MEDALVIYRLSRAPERRIFYIDVGNLPKAKAEQYMADVMNKYRNKLVYNADTGEIKDDRKHMSMLEDFWLPRREGGRGTEITTLPGGQNLAEIQGSARPAGQQNNPDRRQRTDEPQRGRIQHLR